MAQGKTKYDPLEAAKLGTDQPQPPAAEAFSTPKAPTKAKEFDVTDADPPPARRPRYTLLKDKRVSIRGQICDFKAGRVIDSAGYDVDNLRAQGCEMELIKE